MASSAAGDQLLAGTLWGDAGSVLGAYDVDNDRLLVSDDVCVSDVDRPFAATPDHMWLGDWQGDDLVLTGISLIELPPTCLPQSLGRLATGMLLGLVLLACHPGLGHSADAGPPDLCVDQASVDFGEVNLGTYAVIGFALGNCGGSVLTIASITQTGSGAFRYLGAPEFILADDECIVDVCYTPAGTTGDTGTLRIESDDPDQPTFHLTLTGTGL